jgi:hypothetical protein
MISFLSNPSALDDIEEELKHRRVRFPGFLKLSDALTFAKIFCLMIAHSSILLIERAVAFAKRCHLYLQVDQLGFWDVVLDFILIDAFEDLGRPPSAVLAVAKNRFLSDSFKESTLTTVIWSMLKAKRQRLQVPSTLPHIIVHLNRRLHSGQRWLYCAFLRHLRTRVATDHVGFPRDERAAQRTLLLLQGNHGISLLSVGCQ